MAPSERLAGDTEKPERCGDCGSEVIHAQGNDADYYVCCTNEDCEHRLGENVSDDDCPGWAHGKSSKDDYVTAGELRRENGRKLSEEIPDCAYVRRSAIRYRPRDAKDRDVRIDPKTGALCFVFADAVITEPFRWVDAVYTVDAKPRKL